MRKLTANAIGGGITSWRLLFNSSGSELWKRIDVNVTPRLGLFTFNVGLQHLIISSFHDRALFIFSLHKKRTPFQYQSETGRIAREYQRGPPSILISFPTYLLSYAFFSSSQFMIDKF